MRAAHDSFVVKGYAGTTIADIAAMAAVSVPTVYAAFTSKAELLKQAIDVALAGDDEPVTVADRPTAQWVAAADTAEELLGRYAVMMGELAARTGPIYAVLVHAADGDCVVAELLASLEAQRLRAAEIVANAVNERGGLPAGCSVADARDVIWLCNAPEAYTMLVTKRGWSTERYVAWARTTLVRLVLEPMPEVG